MTGKVPKTVSFDDYFWEGAHAPYQGIELYTTDGAHAPEEVPHIHLKVLTHLKVYT